MSIKLTYFSFCLWRRWGKILYCPDWPHPVCDAHLCLAPSLEAPLWLGRGRESALCLESSAVFRAAAAHLQKESEQAEGYLSAAAEKILALLFNCTPVLPLEATGGCCLCCPCLFSSSSCLTSVTLVGDGDLGLVSDAVPPILFLLKLHQTCLVKRFLNTSGFSKQHITAW